MNFSYGLVLMYWGTDLDHGKGPSPVEGWQWLQVSFFSMVLFLLNLLLIYICALFIFWIKDIRPPMPDASLSRFLEENPLRINDGDGYLNDDDVPLVSPADDDGLDSQ